MKKIVSLMLVFMLSLSLVACGGKDKTVSDYVDSIQDEIDELVESMEGQGYTFDIVARGNSLVYTYKYEVEIPDLDGAKELLEAGLEENAGQFEDIYDELKKEIPSAKSVIVEYLAEDGSVIVSREYK